jgi:uncharacterized membrane-anchored protein YhcB (DUF1043 family)
MNRDWLTILFVSILIAALLGLVVGLEIGMRIERKQGGHYDTQRVH